MHYNNKPHVVSNITLQRIRGSLGLSKNNGIRKLTGGQRQPIINRSHIPSPPILPNYSIFKGWSLPRLTLFEIVIIGFGLWLLWELYKRYKKNRKLRKEQRKYGKKQKKQDLIDVAYNYMTDRHEYYPDNLQYLYDGNQKTGINYNLTTTNEMDSYGLGIDAYDNWMAGNSTIPLDPYGEILY